MIIANENIPLFVLAIIWIIGAIMQDLKRREVDNIWNFSLIGFALAYRLFFSIYSGNYWFIANGLIGFIIFIVLGNLFYYMRIFAGGDAKLLIALGTILPLSYNWLTNFKIFTIYILLFFFTGAVYVFLWSIFLVLIHPIKFSKEFYIIIKKYKLIISAGIIMFFLSLILLKSFNELIFLSIGVSTLLLPILYVFAKAVEESFLIKTVNPKKITEGEWLYHDINVSGRKISADWDGISKSELKFLSKKHIEKIKIKIGIPFTPSFLFGILGLLLIDFKFNWLF